MQRADLIISPAVSALMATLHAFSISPAARYASASTIMAKKSLRTNVVSSTTTRLRLAYCAASAGRPRSRRQCPNSADNSDSSKYRIQSGSTSGLRRSNSRTASARTRSQPLASPSDPWSLASGGLCQVFTRPYRSSSCLNSSTVARNRSTSVKPMRTPPVVSLPGWRPDRCHRSEAAFQSPGSNSARTEGASPRSACHSRVTLSAASAGASG
jgi:hypothetical protein